MTGSRPRRRGSGDEDLSAVPESITETRRDAFSLGFISDHRIVCGACSGDGDRFGAGVTHNVR
jgi:hypothetical protein